ncbi:MAG TPA: SLC13 family permease [Thermoanaerobaculia bacterium]|nr:SLC13 family permease [Thermoanaerobaculia bacterium]
MLGAPALLVLVALATAAFLGEVISPDRVALGLLAVLLLLRYVDFEEAFSGFASPAIVILVSAFLFSGALERSGITRRLGSALVRWSGRRNGVLQGAILVTAAGFSLVMNNIAAAAVLLPGVSDALRQRRISPSKVLLPLAFATQLGGMATLLTTSNIVVGEMLRQRGFRPFGLMDFLPIGGTLAIAGLLYAGFVAPRLLPARSEPEDRLARGAAGRSLTQIYELGRRIESARILPGSPLAGTTLGKSGLAHALGVVVVAVVRPDGSQRRAPERDFPLGAGDILVLDGVPPDPAVIREAGLEVIRLKKPTRYLSSPRVALVEGVVGPRSRFANKSLREVNFREALGGVSVLSIWRDGGFVESARLAEAPLKFGDGLLMQGPRAAFRRMREEGDVLVLGHEDLTPPANPARTRTCLAIILGALAGAMIFPSSVATALFVGAVALLLFGGLSSDEAYRSVDWRAVALIGAMLPLSIALTHSGAAAMVSRTLVGASHARSPRGLLALFTVLTAALTQIIPGGAATPLIVGPIAVATAGHVGADPRAFAMAVALGTSTSMLTPFSHPVNVLVMGPGGYRFGDYVRAGLPLTIGLVAGIILLVPRFFPL